ncbi:F0F1 ATP synthase subunit gamma [Mycoplasma sp. NEAQ87857]|uniref:ATP synthase F1 subunit gamma n=1 Tax=Mycoplasma sp. NEAQ87857 TaxID=2683967 RepID=UPI001316D2AD|nr:ATP synthase F1 subunit gamma [Mycoplasma sp. NEAQ87857]QGZ97662.1 F0F1 ATP synthase subunit gamma [Mycoplasma sp. NEAQ87857]
MANLNSLKNRISVVNNTKKITNAMQLVATAKLRRTREEFQNIQSYLDLLNDTFNSLLDHVKETDFYNIFPKNTDIKAKLYVVITSDLGLCGSYNTNVINMLKSQISKQDKIIVIGTKGYNIIHSSYLRDQIIDSYVNYGEKVSYEIGSQITKKALAMYNNKEISEINLIYTKFINNINQDPVCLTLFPLNLNNHTASSETIEFEPNAEVVLKNSIPLYVGSLIYCLGTSSKVSEMASRRNAMENATNNASDLIHDLNLQFNRERQRVITQEINEIVAGADAT